MEILRSSDNLGKNSSLEKVEKVELIRTIEVEAEEVYKTVEAKKVEELPTIARKKLGELPKMIVGGTGVVTWGGLT